MNGLLAREMAFLFTDHVKNDSEASIFRLVRNLIFPAVHANLGPINYLGCLDRLICFGKFLDVDEFSELSSV